MLFSSDIPIKVVGFLPQNKERSLLLKMVYALFERLSIYRYGRVELNLFISEKEYRVTINILLKYTLYARIPYLKLKCGMFMFSTVRMELVTNVTKPTLRFKPFKV